VEITNEEIRHVANLARLDLQEDDLEMFTGQVGKILQYIDTLNRVDTDQIEPAANALPLSNAFRNDDEKEHANRNAALSNAPVKEGGVFLVPKIIED